MKTAATSPTSLTSPTATSRPTTGPGREAPFHRRLPIVIGVALSTGLLTTLVLVLVVVTGAPEPVVTGSAWSEWPPAGAFSRCSPPG